MNTFKIFIPIKNSSINIDWIFTITITLSLLFVFLVDYYEEIVPETISKISVGFLIFNLILVIVIQIISHFLYQSLSGAFDGEIILNDDSINLGEKTLAISTIKKLEVFIQDYKGMHIWHQKTLKPKLQQGVKNAMKIELISGDILSVNFLQAYKNEFQKSSEYLKKYYLEGKIHFLHLIDLLEITDYNDIQNLKKELNEKKTLRKQDDEN
ncbi:hypothetical protein [Mariniflexile sp. AS56]|nr:hypothetical protein [Mariniflexile sp. AS56]MDO7171822.1 hypothetical protein [Mariniflexile sp. AS56]